MANATEIVIEPRPREMENITVRRILPSAGRRAVGPFVFLDQMGPVELPPGEGLDVRPHPHIGLATITWLFEGEIVHRDSLGYQQPIRPGDVNWMVAGRGIVHSERTGAALRRIGVRMSGLQAWIGLPSELEETEPSFEHHAEKTLPTIDAGGVRLRLIAGRAFGETAPVRTLSEMFYLAAETESAGTFELPDGLGERALYTVDGEIVVEGQTHGPGRLVVFAPDGAIEIAAGPGSRFMLLGGAPLEGKRHMWWNFVSSSRERIEQAKAEWTQGRFEKVPGDDDFTPLPER